MRTNPMCKLMTAFWVIISLVSCVPIVSTPANGTPSTETVDAPFPIVTTEVSETPALPTPGKTMVPPSSTPTLTSTMIRKNCLTQLEDQQGQIRGIALMWEGQGGDKKGFLYDLFNQSILRMPGDDIFFPVISLDHQRLAYKKNVPDELVIWDSRDQSTKIYPWEKEWQTIVEWLNNRELVIEIPSGEADYYTKTVLFDTETGMSRDLDFQPPDLYKDYHYPEWGPYFAQRIVYSPDLTRALYAKVRSRMALYDLIEGKEITSFIAGLYGLSPQKSQDGHRILFLNKLKGDDQWNLYELTWEGKLRQLTYFPNLPEWLPIYAYTWSPHGKTVAIVLADYSGGVPGKISLNLLDLDDLSITDLCLPEMNTDRSIDSPVWLGNGEQLLFTMFDEDNLPSTLLLDLKEKTYRVIYPEAEVAGWLAGP